MNAFMLLERIRIRKNPSLKTELFSSLFSYERLQKFLINFTFNRNFFTAC